MIEVTEDQMFVEVPERTSIKTRPVEWRERDETLERRRKLMRLTRLKERLEEEIHVLEQRCPHTVRYDTTGYVYHVRRCAGCDKHLGDV